MQVSPCPVDTALLSPTPANKPPIQFPAALQYTKDGVAMSYASWAYGLTRGTHQARPAGAPQHSPADSRAAAPIAATALGGGLSPWAGSRRHRDRCLRYQPKLVPPAAAYGAPVAGRQAAAAAPCAAHLAGGVHATRRGTAAAAAAHLQARSSPVLSVERRLPAEFGSSGGKGGRATSVSQQTTHNKCSARPVITHQASRQQ